MNPTLQKLQNVESGKGFWFMWFVTVVAWLLLIAAIAFMSTTYSKHSISHAVNSEQQHN